MLCILLPSKTVQRMRLWEQVPQILHILPILHLSSKEDYKLFIRGFSPFFQT